MRKRVFIIVPFLGVIRRGFESSGEAIFEALKNSGDFKESELFLLRGKHAERRTNKTQHGKNDIAAWSMKMGSWWNKFWTKLLKKSPEVIALDSYFFGLLPYILIKKPAILVLQDRHLGNRLFHLRRLFGSLLNLKFKIYFINGGPFSPPLALPRGRFDHVQHLTDFHYNESIKAGDEAKRLSMIPYGETIGEFKNISEEERISLRKELKLPVFVTEFEINKNQNTKNRKIILSCAALNKKHKRIDYLINEVAKLCEGLPMEERPFLVMLGQKESETQELMKLAWEKLGAENFLMKEVSREEVVKYYRAADLFVLSSLNEGFGRVLVEAMREGLPCVVHDYAVTRFVLGEFGLFADFTKNGTLANELNKALRNIDEQKMKNLARFNWVRERYGWKTIVPKMRESFLRCLER